MQGDPGVIAHLNQVLRNELTAINQYFLHARMFDNWGFDRLGEHERHESIDEMKHADRLAERILFLDGLPNFQKLSPLRIGQTVKEQFQSDMKIEEEAITRLREGIEYMRSVGDITSAIIFEDILQDEEHHIDYLETQLDLMDTLGEQLYLQNVTEHPEAS